MDQLTPDDIKNLASLAEIAKGADPTIAKIVGGLVSVAGAVIAILTHINNLRTKKNTDSQERFTKFLSGVEARFNQKVDQSLEKYQSLVEGLEASVKTARTHFEEEERLFKLKVMRLHEDANGVASEIADIPKVRTDIASLEKRTLDTAIEAAQTKKKVDDILSIVKRAKGRGV